ncbi:MAG TPA: nitrate- and nitrite sensing domain-containing protein [Trebonia sp.]
MARRLFAVIMAALLMGLVFGGLRVAAAQSSAAQFSQTEQLAKLGIPLTTVVDDLQNERDATLVTFLGGQAQPPLKTLQAQTRSDLLPVRQALAAILGGGFPSTVAATALTVNNAVTTAGVRDLQDLAVTASDPNAVFDDYAAVIGFANTLQEQVALGVTDGALTGDVQTLNALALAKDQMSQEQALLDEVLTAKTGFVDLGTEASLRVANQDELTQVAAFQNNATQQESALFDDQLGPQPKKLASETLTDNLESSIFADASGTQGTGVTVGTDGIPLNQVIANQLNLPGTTPAQLQKAWDAGMGAKIDALAATEHLVAGNLVTRATQLQQSAHAAALTYLVITVAVLLLVLVAALLVARSLVLPLRRLRAGALDIASVQLPERVRLLSESPESTPAVGVTPINVFSQDEIGQVARAFDRVHSEAVRLAGEQALLRSSFNAMFVNLSRRSQTLIERLTRMIDNLEQHEDDPDRLGNLFSMDHLVTRMRRNSENLLLLAGHENPRKWSQAAPLADVARAATSEIEQYNRVTLNIATGVSLVGQAVSDVMHLLAELIENATTFSSKDTQVVVTTHELNSGGVLIEIIDQGIGVSEVRLEEINRRLDDPPPIDVSVSRHMGLFAVARLAERHRVRVRLRSVQPQGVSALVWLPDSLLEQDSQYAAVRRPPRTAAVRGREREPAGYSTAGHSLGGQASAGPSLAGPSLAGRSLAGQPGPDGGYGQGAPAAAKPLGWFRPGQGGGRPLPAASVAASASQEAGGARDWDQRHGLAGSMDRPRGSDQTAAGLPVRVPKSSLTPGGGPDGEAGGPPGGPARGRANGSDGKSLPQRSPDQARSRLAGFQRGTRRAEGQDGISGQPSRAGEGTTT